MRVSLRRKPKPPYCIRMLEFHAGTGERIWEMNRSGSQAVTYWLEKRGCAIEDSIRGYGRGEEGRILFHSGAGYNLIDSDLLDGDGSGATHRAFATEMGECIQVLTGVDDTCLPEGW